VLVAMGLLTSERLEDWRFGRVPFLERVINCNLRRLSRLLRILRFQPTTCTSSRHGRRTCDGEGREGRSSSCDSRRRETANWRSRTRPTSCGPARRHSTNGEPQRIRTYEAREALTRIPRLRAAFPARGRCEASLQFAYPGCVRGSASPGVSSAKRITLEPRGRRLARCHFVLLRDLRARRAFVRVKPIDAESGWCSGMAYHENSTIIPAPS
jgi:hypothetical protein